MEEFEPPDRSASVDVDALIAQLRAKVEARRRAGDYPPGLEEELSGHFRRVLGQRHADPPPHDLQEKLAAMQKALPLERRRIPVESEFPGGQVVHRAVAKAVSRQTDGVFGQLQEFAQPVAELLESIVESLQCLQDRIDKRLGPQIEAVLERQAEQERADGVAGPLNVHRYDGLRSPAEELRGATILRLEEGEGLAPLIACPPASLDGLAVAAPLRRLSTGEIVDLVSLAAVKVRAGGWVLVEMANGSGPAHPADVSFLFSEAGFGKVEINWRTASAAEISEDALHDRFLRPRDYFVLAHR